MCLARVLFLTGAAVALVAVPVRADEPAKPPAEVSYYKDVRPIFQQHCQGCHQPAKAQGDYVMTGHADLFKLTVNNARGISPGKPADSEVVKQIIGINGEKPKMPRGKDPLAERDVTIIKKW